MTESEPDSGWQLEGDSAAAYEKYLVSAFASDWATRLVDFAEVVEGERVLDVGCGTGIVARTAAPVVGNPGSVTGVDINEDMLDVARRVSADIEPPIDWRCQDATSLDFPDESFDVVLSQQALQFIPDQDAALAEMRRVLTPNGRLAFSLNRSLAHNQPYAVLADALDQHVGTQAGDGIRSIFTDVSVEGLRGLVEDAGFHDVHVRIEIPTVRYPSAAEMLRREAASSPLAGPVSELTPETREKLVQDLADALAPYVDDDGLLLPISMYLVSARP